MTAISISTQQKIDVIESDDMFTIRKCDWKRVKRLVNNISKPSKFISIIYSILFGISGSAFLTLIPLNNSQNIESWVIPLYLIIAIASLLLAIILLIIEKKILKDETKTVNEINKEFVEIESLFNPSTKK